MLRVAEAKMNVLSEEHMAWYRKMIDAYDNLLSEEEKRALAEWEKNNLPDKATSDWPGWIKYIGPPPWKVRAN